MARAGDGRKGEALNRNVEIKARSSDRDRQIEKAARISDAPPQVIDQEDTFFPSENGRLKMRRFGDGTFGSGACGDRPGEVIYYERANATGPKESRYLVCAVPEASRLSEVLRAALGTRGVVRKKRTLFLVGKTRIHFDEVEGLGNFIELEVVLDPGQTESEGMAVARGLMKALGIREHDLVDRSYVDLLGGWVPGITA